VTAGLLQTVENTIKHEHDLSPNRPIYLVGDSFGGCLAVAVAARNPQIDLLLILVNPATSFAKTPLQPILPLLESMPSEFHVTVPYLLSFVMGDPLKMASVTIENNLSPPETLQKLSDSLTSMLPLLSVSFSHLCPNLWNANISELHTYYQINPFLFSNRQESCVSL